MANQRRNKLGETPNGKVIESHYIENTTLCCIKFKAGGQLPKELRGAFSDTAVALRRVQDYITRLEQEDAHKKDPKKV